MADLSFLLPHVILIVSGTIAQDVHAEFYYTNTGYHFLQTWYSIGVS